MNEIIITQKAGEFSCDFDAVKAALNDTLAQYRNAVFTEESKKDAKAVVADLRKNKKAFQDRIKDVKAEYMKPYDDFYKKAMELVNMFDEPIDFINGQVAAFEEKRIKEKQELIKAYYDAQVAGHEYASYMPLAKIYNPKWENATCKEKAIVEDMQAWVTKVTEGINAIKSMNSDAEESALKLFSECYDAVACINFINTHEREKAAILERERERVKAEEEARIRREERERIEAERKAEADIKAAVADAKEKFIDDLIPVYDGLDKTRETYKVKVSPSEKEALEMYMNSIGIEWEIIPPIPI